MFEQAKSWPFQEARKLIDHIARKGKVAGDTVTFQTGYGPSGAPHIGTFAEVVRTLWVMKAFDALTDDAYNTRLIMFSDDYDAMRKVPEGLPSWMSDHLGKPLSSVPNPYLQMSRCVANDAEQDAVSFAGANNDRLIAFVDNILRTYDGSVVGSSPDRSRVSFVSSSRYYKSGKFNAMLTHVAEHFNDIQSVMLPTLGEERRSSYSPFLPLREGRLTQDYCYPVTPENQPTCLVVHNDGKYFNTGIVQMLNGGSKLQWKVDWAMRWVYFDVDYEMSGKDLIDSVKASSKICRILGGTPPLNMTYEMFLDEQGAKIAKTKGNGFSMEQWLTYGSPESLMTFLFQNPKSAKPLHIELVPKFEDDYIKMRQKELTPNDAAWFFKANGYVNAIPDVSFGLLLNLAIVAQSTVADEVVRYLAQQRELSSGDHLWIQTMVHRVISYAQKQRLYARETREPTEQEAIAFNDLANRLEAMMPGLDPEAYQFQVYEVGKVHGFQPLRAWFSALYECFLGSSDGPRFGAFTAAYGLENTIQMLRSNSRTLVKEA